MSKETLISIVLPVYNGEKYLEISIQSIIEQTYKNWELIIVDDGSTDKSLRIAKSFADKENRIKIIKNKVNKKLPASLNIGFRNANGDYFTWTSDDNIYKPYAFEKMAFFLKANPNTDMVVMNMDYITEDKSGKIEFLYDYDKNRRYKRCTEELIYDINIGAAFLYRRSIAEKVGNYNESLFCAEDYDYFCRIAIEGTISYTSDNIYIYRLHPSSLSSENKSIVKERTEYIRKKYANKFFNKFNYTEYDKIKLWFNLNRHKFPNEHISYWLFFKISRIVADTISSLFFWNRQLKHKIRKSLYIHNKYSFSEKNS